MVAALTLLLPLKAVLLCRVAITAVIISEIGTEVGAEAAEVVITAAVETTLLRLLLHNAETNSDR
jgi:hypothetical protein